MMTIGGLKERYRCKEKKMKKAIVTTTINPPTKASLAYAAKRDWDFIVVGDTKTPHADYEALDGCIYLSPEKQESIDKQLSDMLGWKTIQRRNMGFVYANSQDYDVIATVDDDNIPLEGWGEMFEGFRPISSNVLRRTHPSSPIIEPVAPRIREYTPTECKFFDPLAVTKHHHLWHRGFPLQHVSQRLGLASKLIESPVFDIQANLWNGDPDVDAVCRMIHNPEVEFSDVTSYYCSSAIAPFNSQNTLLSSRVLKDYFVFDRCGRMDDIFGAYIVQKLGYKVCFGPPTVYQERNPHDLTEDMKKEYIGYENVQHILGSEEFIHKPSYERYRELMQ